MDVKDLKHFLAKQVGEDKERYYYFFSKNGYTQQACSYAEKQGVRLVKLIELLLLN